MGQESLRAPERGEPAFLTVSHAPLAVGYSDTLRVNLCMYLLLEGPGRTAGDVPGLRRVAGEVEI